MRFAAQDDLIVPTCQGDEAHKVRHNAAGHEQGCFLTHSFCGKRFQSLHGGIFAQHIIAHLRPRHRATHRRRGLRYGVRTQINHPLRFAHHSTPL
jgi:hypothetical protein